MRKNIWNLRSTWNLPKLGRHQMRIHTATLEFYLQQFEMYEKFRKAEEIKYRRRMLKACAKSKAKGSKKTIEMEGFPSQADVKITMVCSFEFIRNEF